MYEFVRHMANIYITIGFLHPILGDKIDYWFDMTLLYWLFDSVTFWKFY